MGHIKVAGNYAASLYPHKVAKRAGYPVVLHLDAKEHKWIDEFSTSNFLAVTREGTYVTPKSASILPSITNMTLQQIAKDLGIPVEVRPIAFDEVTDFAEVAACGTAVVITPVCQIERAGMVYDTGSETGVRPRAGEAVQNGSGHPIRRIAGHPWLERGSGIARS